MKKFINKSGQKKTIQKWMVQLEKGKNEVLNFLKCQKVRTAIATAYIGKFNF